MNSPERELQLEFLVNHLPPIHFQVLEMLIVVLQKLVVINKNDSFNR